MNTITKDTLIKMRADIDAALATVGAKYNVSIRVGSTTYDPEGGTATCKLEVATRGADGAERNMEGEAFQRYASLLGLSPDDLGKNIWLAGKLYAISGYRPKARKNPIVVRNANGKAFVVTVEAVKRQLQKSA